MDDIIFYVGAISFLTATVFGVIGLGQGFQSDASNPEFISFRKSSFSRLSMGMLSLLFLGSIWPIAKSVRPVDREMFWWLMAPMFAGGSYLLAYLAGPQDVRIDLASRICYETKGWFFHPRKQTYQLTESSFLCAYCGGQACYTMLRVGDPGNRRFVLAMRGNKNEALRFAQSIADKLHLPVRETEGPGI